MEEATGALLVAAVAAAARAAADLVEAV